MSTTTVPVVAESEQPEPEAPTYGALLPADRCDWCTAQAFVRVVHPSAEAWHGLMNQDLLFCGHHWTRAQKTGKLDGWEVHDERDKIN